MEECLLLLVFKGRHTIQYFQETGQIYSIQVPQSIPFFLIWIFKTCMYFGVQLRYVHLLRWETSKISVLKWPSISSNWRTYNAMDITEATRYCLIEQVCMVFWKVLNVWIINLHKKYQFLPVKRGNMLMKSPCTFPYFSS